MYTDNIRMYIYIYIYPYTYTFMNVYIKNMEFRNMLYVSLYFDIMLMLCLMFKTKNKK